MIIRDLTYERLCSSPPLRALHKSYQTHQARKQGPNYNPKLEKEVIEQGGGRACYPKSVGPLAATIFPGVRPTKTLGSSSGPRLNEKMH